MPNDAKQPELSVGDKVTADFDALSHSFNYYRVEMEVIDRQSVGFDICDNRIESLEMDNEDEGFGLDIAVCKILSWVEFDEDETKAFLDPDASKVGLLETLVRVSGGRWTATVWVQEMEFVEKEN